MAHPALLLLALGAFLALCAGLPRHQQALYQRALISTHAPIGASRWT